MVLRDAEEICQLFAKIPAASCIFNSRFLDFGCTHKKGIDYRHYYSISSKEIKNIVKKNQDRVQVNFLGKLNIESRGKALLHHIRGEATSKLIQSVEKRKQLD